MDEKAKKPIYKRWWFIVIAVIVFFGIIGSFMEDEQIETTSEELPEETGEEESEEPVEEVGVDVDDEPEENDENNEEEKPEADSVDDTESLTEEEQLRKIVEDYLPEMDAEVNKIDINYNFGRDDGTHLVLPHLIWPVRNGAKMTREMLEIYSARLANEFSGLDNVSDITVFWEVPHHAEGSNIAKFEFISNDGEIEYVGYWYDEILRD